MTITLNKANKLIHFGNCSCWMNIIKKEEQSVSLLSRLSCRSYKSGISAFKCACSTNWFRLWIHMMSYIPYVGKMGLYNTQNLLCQKERLHFFRFQNSWWVSYFGYMLLLMCFSVHQTKFMKITGLFSPFSG